MMYFIKFELKIQIVYVEFDVIYDVNVLKSYSFYLLVVTKTTAKPLKTEEAIRGMCIYSSI